MFLTDSLVMQQLADIARERAPEEAVGLILADGHIIELTNRSKSPRDSFEVLPEDLIAHMGAHDITDWARVTLWHSHPAGGIGPSRTDMRYKLGPLQHLVLSLRQDEVIPSWY